MSTTMKEYIASLGRKRVVYAIGQYGRRPFLRIRGMSLRRLVDFACADPCLRRMFRALRTLSRFVKRFVASLDSSVTNEEDPFSLEAVHMLPLKSRFCYSRNGCRFLCDANGLAEYISSTGVLRDPFTNCEFSPAELLQLDARTGFRFLLNLRACRGDFRILQEELLRESDAQASLMTCLMSLLEVACDEVRLLYGMLSSDYTHIALALRSLYTNVCQLNVLCAQPSLDRDVVSRLLLDNRGRLIDEAAAFPFPLTGLGVSLGRGQDKMVPVHVAVGLGVFCGYIDRVLSESRLLGYLLSVRETVDFNSGRW